MDEGTAIDWQCSAGNEIRLVGRQKKRRVCDVPRGAHLVGSGTRASRAAAISSRLLRLARARVSSAIGVSINPGRMTFARTLRWSNQA